MGYKSTLRSVGASINKASKEADKRHRAQAREAARLQKKINSLDEKKDKIRDALNDQYAKGKVTKEEYKKLMGRDDDITLEILIFGKSPAVTLAKRYICGKIDKKEFDEKCSDFLPYGVLEEKERIKDQFNELIERVEDFRESCKDFHDGICQKCSKQKKWLPTFHKLDGLYLCWTCRTHLRNMRRYSGFRGKYFEAPPAIIDKKMINTPSLTINIKSDYL